MGHVTLSLVVRPEWANAASLRSVIVALVKTAVGDDDAATNAGMVGCELAENAIKYGDWSHAEGFGFRLAIEGTKAWIEVASPYDPSSGSLVRLDRILGSMKERSATDAYLLRLHEIAETSGTGQLGLLRIAHELGAQITVAYNDDRLCVRAAWQLG